MSKSTTFSNVPYLSDTIGVGEAVQYFFKKSIGYPNTTPHGAILTEIDGNFNSYPFLTVNKAYNQQIPYSNPNDYILDPTFSNNGFNIYNTFTTYRSDSFSKRYYSASYPYIVMYSNLLLTNFARDAVPYTQFGYTSLFLSYGHPLLVNSIPPTYNNNRSYSWKLTNSNNTEITTTDGWWVCDTDAGVITFYDSNTIVPQLSNTNLPRFTFYRYEGLIGSTNVATTQDL